MPPFVVHDIETVENDRAHRYFTQEKKYYPRANLKKEDAIEKDIAEKRQKDIEKAALHWWSGKVICICANVVGIKDVKPVAFVGENEAELLCSYFDWLLGLARSVPDFRIVGKCGDTFDRPFLIGRALVHDIGIPYLFRPYRPIDDIDHIFGFSASRCAQIGTLNDYAFGLGMEVKTMHGSQVGDLYNMIKMGDASQWQTIASYCSHDVAITREMVARYSKDYIERNQEPMNEPKPLEESEIPFG